MSDMSPTDGDEIARGARKSLDAIINESTGTEFEIAWRALSDRIRNLESKVGLLSAENIALRSKLIELAERSVAPKVAEPTRKSAREPEVQIFVDPPRVSNFIPPTREEAAELRQMLGVNFPPLLNTAGLIAWQRGLDEDTGLDAWLQQFGLALRALSDRMFSTPKPIISREWFTFREICSQSVRKDIGAMPFLAAVLACGQVPYSGLFMDGCVISLGLNEHVGKPIKADGWKQTLATRKILAPSLVERIMTPVQSQVTVRHFANDGSPLD